MVVEFIGGWISNSVAIMTDAAHMLSDCLAFGISIFSICVSKWQPTEGSSYGYHRTEILGAITSIVIIWALVVYLCIEAADRVHMIMHGKAYEIDAYIMLVTACISLVCNIIGLIAVGHCCCGDGGVLHDITSVFKPHGNHDCGHDHSGGTCSHHHNHAGHDHDHGHHHHHHKEHDHEHQHLHHDEGHHA